MEKKIIDDMNSFEFLSLMLQTIDTRFHTDFPEYFIRCRTLDKEIHDSANKSGYSYYIKILNAIKHGCFETEFKIDDFYSIDGIDIYAERKRLLDSLINSEDVRIWCFNNLQL